MGKVALIGCAVTTILCAVLAQSPHAYAATTTRCDNQTLGAVTVTGNLVVPAGAFCDLMGTHVTGNADIQPNAGLLAENGATIDRSVEVERDGQFAAFGGSTVGGSVRCDDCGAADLHNSTVKGSLADNGMKLGAFIENSQISKNLSIQHSQDGGSGFTLVGNAIGRSLDFKNNTGASDISGNTIKGELECAGNSPPPSGSGNMAAEKEGQCAAL